MHLLRDARTTAQSLGLSSSHRPWNQFPLLGNEVREAREPQLGLDQKLSWGIPVGVRAGEWAVAGHGSAWKAD